MLDAPVLHLFGRRTLRHFAGCSLLLLFAQGCVPVAPDQALAAQNDHGHDHETDEPEPVAITVFTDKVELFMEYPQLVPGQEARFLAHVTVLATGEPVRSGSLTLEFFQGLDSVKLLEAAKPKRDGLFIPEGVFDTPGKFGARIVVTSDQVTETITLPTVTVHATVHDASHAAEANARPDPPDAVPFLLEQQWKILLLMEQVQRRSLTRRLQLPGEIEAPPGGMAVVSAPLAGRLSPPESGRLPQLGDQVQQGQILGYLEPPLTPGDQAQLAATRATLDTIEMELLVREYDLQNRSLEVELELNSARTQLAFAEQVLTRIKSLREKDLGTQVDLQAAHRDVELARQKIAANESLKEALVQSKERLDALILRTAESGSQGRTTARHALHAPIAGEIVEAPHVEGLHLEAQQTIVRILDLSRVWISAQVSEFDLAEVGAEPGALLQVAAYPGRRFDVLGDLEGWRVHTGSLVDPVARTIDLRYEAANHERIFRVGMFCDLYLETSQALDVVAMPEQAIVMDNGQPVAFVLVHGEMFQKRVLELGIRDGGLIEIKSGVEAGERVVTEGAYLVKLAAASPASFGAGHAH